MCGSEHGKATRLERLLWEREAFLVRLSTDAVVRQVASERARIVPQHDPPPVLSALPARPTPLRNQ
jgi:hypothetical protein